MSYRLGLREWNTNGKWTVPAGGRDEVRTDITEEDCDDFEASQNYPDNVGGINYQRTTTCKFD